ncbi:MAG: 60S acidic ribosomal protein P2 [archaeon]|nr:60S acidic ribosomal protein P2 [archaeon]
MKIIAAYILAVLGGNAAPTAASINQILESVGASAEADAVTAFLGEVDGKDIWSLISTGSAKLASAPTGGAGPAVSGSSAGAGPAAVAVEEEKKKEESEADIGGTFDLFGGEGGEGGDAAEY